MTINFTNDNLSINSEATFIGTIASVYFNPYGFILKDDSGLASLDFTEQHTMNDIRKYLNMRNKIKVKVQVNENRHFKILEIEEMKQ